MCVNLLSKTRSIPRDQSDVKPNVFDFNENNNSNLHLTRQSSDWCNVTQSSESACTPSIIDNNQCLTNSLSNKVQPGSSDHCSRQLHPQVLNCHMHGSNLPLTCASLAPSPSSHLSSSVPLSFPIGHSQPWRYL